MPRISAPTVAEHRSRQLATLLEAARELVVEQGSAALTLTALARRVGVSRTGLYEYFRSRESLVAAIVEDELPRAVERIHRALREASPDLATQIRAYVHAQVEVICDPRHAAVSALAVQALPAAHIRHILEGHGVMVTPLAGVLTRAGIPDAELRAELVQAVVDAAGRRIQQEGPTAGAAVIDTAVAQILHGLQPVKPPRRRGAAEPG